jgi:hypothetical protein
VEHEQAVKTRSTLTVVSVTAYLLAMSCGGVRAGGGRAEIGDGYAIAAANSFDVGVVSPNGLFVLNPRNYANVGPVVEYAATPTRIMTMNLGAKRRNLFEGDVFVEADESKRLFFVISKGSNEVIGPMEETEFLRVVEAMGIDSPYWRTPEQAYREQALSGGTARNGFPAAVAAFAVGLAIRFRWLLCAAVVAFVLVALYVLGMWRWRRLARKALGGVHPEDSDGAG